MSQQNIELLQDKNISTPIGTYGNHALNFLQKGPANISKIKSLLGNEGILSGKGFQFEIEKGKQEQIRIQGGFVATTI